MRIEFQSQMTLQTQFVFTWEIVLRIERSRRMKISFRVVTRFWGSLHDSGMSFNPERLFKLNACLHGGLSRGLKDHGE